jgi:hypothetical protein
MTTVELLNRLRDPEQRIPLTRSQRRFWLYEQLVSETSLYNVPVFHRIIGALDASALEKAIHEIVRRHESLRTTFTVEQNDPQQVVATHLQVPLCLRDLSATKVDEREKQARRVMVEEASLSFDLEQGPLIRTSLIRLQDDEHLFLLTLHHIITDGWSVGVFFKELSQLYAAFTNGVEPSLPELPLQVADYILWQRDHVEQTVLPEQMRYWRKQLLDMPVRLELPVDVPHGGVTSDRGTMHRFHFSNEVLQSLKELGREEGATLYMTLLASFKALLYRLTGQEDLVIGSVVANRNHSELSGLIGFIANTLPLRTQLSGELTFRELLERVRKTCLQAFAYSDCPLEKLAEECFPERNSSDASLLQAICIFQPPVSPATLAGVKLEPVEIENGTAKYDLTLAFEESDSGLHGYLEYKLDLFRSETIVSIIDQLECLMEAVIADPDQPLSQMEFRKTRT